MSERYHAGLAALLALSNDKEKMVGDALAAEAPEFARLIVEVVFGDTFSRAGLDQRTRLFVAIGALAAPGSFAGRPALVRSRNARGGRRS